jgi:hypothetical protein
MKSLSQYICESRINESANPELAKLLGLGNKGINNNDDSVWPVIKVMFAWDKMTEDDFNIIDETEFTKRFRKKADINTLFVVTETWMNGKVFPIFACYGSDMIDCKYYNYSASGHRNMITINYFIKNILPNLADPKIIAIENSNKFSTAELKRLRIDQKSGAAALRDSLLIAADNNRRYEQILSDNRFQKDLHADVTALINQATEKFSEISNKIRNIETEEIAPESLNILNNKLRDAVELYSEILDYGKAAISKQIEYKDSTYQFEHKKLRDFLDKLNKKLEILNDFIID